MRVIGLLLCSVIIGFLWNMRVIGLLSPQNNYIDIIVYGVIALIFLWNNYRIVVV